MTQPDNMTPYKASVYDANVRSTIPFYEVIHRETVDLVKTVMPAVDCWLDAGCGTGYLVEMALPLFPKTRFILADPSERMLKEAMKRLEGAPRQSVEFLPPLPNQQLSSCPEGLRPQVVTSLLCHHYLHPPQRQEAVRACHHILEDGGVFISFENIDPGSASVARIALERWKRFQIRQGRPDSAAEEHTLRFKTKYFPITIGEHIDLLKTIGFRVAEVFWLSQMQAGFYAIK
jgi:tRNA (cmo5U34)-methyltransferase